MKHWRRSIERSPLGELFNEALGIEEDVSESIKDETACNRDGEWNMWTAQSAATIVDMISTRNSALVTSKAPRPSLPQQE